MENAPKSKVDTLRHNCESVEADLDDYLDGALSARACKSLERHLNACSSCSELVADIRNVVTAARSLAELPIPSGVSERLRAHLSAELGLRFTEVKPNLVLIKS